jgi:hypothetical protein
VSCEGSTNLRNFDAWIELATLGGEQCPADTFGSVAFFRDSLSGVFSFLSPSLPVCGFANRHSSQEAATVRLTDTLTIAAQTVHSPSGTPGVSEAIFRKIWPPGMFEA